MWEYIPGYKGLYLVDIFGDVFSLYSNKILRYSISKDGYKQYNLYKNGKAKIMTAHKAVALTFVPNENNYSIVNHKDENKMNCYYKNLEWCSSSYNASYGSAPEKRENYYNSVRKKFFVYEKDGTNIGVFNGIEKYCRENGCSCGSIIDVMKENLKRNENFRTYRGKIYSYCEIKFKP